MGLAEYRRKRRFAVPPEPAGSARAQRAAKALAFVVQKHRATRLHYDNLQAVFAAHNKWTTNGSERSP